MQKATRFRERPATRLPRTRPHVSARPWGHSCPLPYAGSRRGTPRRRRHLFLLLLRWQSLKTSGGFVLIVFSIFAAGPCQLWQAEHRAQLGALLGFPRPPSMVAPLQYAPSPLAPQVQSPSFTPGTPPAVAPTPPAPLAPRFPPAPAAPLGAKPLVALPHLAGLLLDYSFNTAPVAVVSVLRYPWEVILTDPHQFHVHWGADSEEKQPSVSAVSVPVLAVKAQGPYVAIWIADPGVLLEAAEAAQSYRFQLSILPGAVTRAEDGRSVTDSTHAFTVSEQTVSDNLPFLDMMTPEHRRESGTKATHPSGPEATRALFLSGVGLDPDAPPTPLARIVARREGSPQIPPGFFAADAPQEGEHYERPTTRQGL